jgi:tetratricopeptide (TPR) repeat protein
MRQHWMHNLPRAAIAVIAVATLASLLVIAFDQNDIPAHTIAAAQARSNGDRSGERTALEALHSTDPAQVDVIEKLAVIARGQGRWLDAAAAWAQVAQLNPLHAGAQFEQAKNLAAAGRFVDVAQLLSAARFTSAPDAQVLLIRAQLAIGKETEAKLAHRALLLAFPQELNAVLLSADFHALNGDYALAQKGYSALLDSPGVAAAARLGLIQTNIRLGHRYVAIKLLNGFPDDPSDGFQLLMARAEIWQQLGQIDQAIETMEGLLAQTGPILDVLIPMAELYAAQTKVSSIEKLFVEIEGTTAPDIAARHYLQAILAYLCDDASTAQLRLEWAGSYYGQRALFVWMQFDTDLALGDVIAARAFVDNKYVQDLSLFNELQSRLLAGRLIIEASSAAGRGASEIARDFATLALRLQPDDLTAQVVLSRAALVARDYEAAAAAAMRGVDNPSTRASALEVLGRVALAQQRPDEAIIFFMKLAEINATESIGYYWLGIAYFQQHKNKRAITALTTALELDNSVRIAAALLDVLLVGGELNQAESLARRYIGAAEGSDRSLGWAWLGGVERARGNAGLSINAYQQALLEAPDRLPLMLLTADLLTHEARFDDALALLENAAARHPSNRIVEFKQAYALQLAGSVDLAKTRYQALLRNDPDWALPMLNLSEIVAQQAANPEYALVLATRVTALSPDWLAGHWNLAQRAQESGRLSLARASAATVIRMDPEHAGAIAILDATAEFG